jgi:hypothetical protein
MCTSGNSPVTCRTIADHFKSHFEAKPAPYAMKLYRGPVGDLQLLGNTYSYRYAK